MTTTPMKQRLARQIAGDYFTRDGEEPSGDAIETAGFLLDDVLREMLEPSEGMLQTIMIRQASVKGGRLVLTDEQKDEVEMIVADYKAMIRYIIDEGLPTHEDVLGILNESQD